MTKTRIATLLLVLLGAPGVVEAARCYTFWTFYNDDRIVPGPVNTECGTGTERMHSAPFGNWGVKSRHSGYWDGYQFSGWEPDDGWRQWNSCTSDPQYRTPRYLPEEPQLPDPDVENIYATTRLRGSNGRTCASIHSGRTHIFRNEYMKVYELDSKWDFIGGGNGSDLVTTLSYSHQAISVPMRCSNQSVCRGESSWTRPRWNSRVRASIKIIIHTYYY